MSKSYFMLRFLRKRRTEKVISGNPTVQQKAIFYSDSNHIKCRICLGVGTVPIYNSHMPFDVQDAIRIFGDVEIQEDDSYPKHLCETCQSLLNGAVLFRYSAKESDRLLRHPTTSVTYDDAISSNDCPNEDNLSKTYKCTTCNLEFTKPEEYSAHKSTKLHKNARIQCPICNRLYKPQMYKNHVKRHQSATHLICEVCGKMYRKDNLFRHLHLHTYELPFKCQECPYRGRFTESLKIHMRTHSGDKPFSCDKCKLRFITRSNLNRHLLTHKKDKPYICVECSRGFYIKRDLDAHLKTDHSGIKDFCCLVCGNKYGTRKALMRHELRVHKRDKMAKGRLPLYLQADYRND